VNLATISDVVDATAFLLRNPAINEVNPEVDGVWLFALIKRRVGRHRHRSIRSQMMLA